MITKKLLVSILNYEDYEKTILCVDSLLDISLVKGKKSDVVIVDNKSTNNSFDILKNYYKDSKVDVIRTVENKGYSYGNNFALKHKIASGISYEYFAVINPDVIIRQDLFTPLLETLDHHNDVAVISTLVHFNKKLVLKKQSWRIPTIKEFWQDTFLLNHSNTAISEYKIYAQNLLETEIIPGSFFIIRTSVFVDIGFFDENMFMYNEEIVLGIKIKQLNLKEVIDPRYYYEHNHPVFSKKEIAKNYRNNFSHILYMYKVGYMSRKYVCRKYYKSKGIIMLNIINMINNILLYAKRFLAYFE